MLDPENAELRRRLGLVVDAVLVVSTLLAVFLYLVLGNDILKRLREEPHVLRTPVFLGPLFAAFGAVVTAIRRVALGATARRRLVWLTFVAVAVGGWPWACGRVLGMDGSAPTRMF